MSHGWCGYKRGCRCDECRAGNAAHSRQQRAHHRKPHTWRELVTDTYRDARYAWERRRESSEPVWAVTGAANSGCACYQLEDDDYRALFPPPTFKDVLLALRGTTTRQEAVA